MSKQEKEAAELKKELEERRAELAMLAKKNQIKAKAKATKVEKSKSKSKSKPKAKATKVEKPKAKAKATKVEKPKPKAKAKAKAKATKVEKPKAKPKAKATKVEKPKAKGKAKATKVEKPKAKGKAKATKVEEEPEIPKTMEEEFEDQYSDEELRNFRIEKKDMEQLTNKVCEILATYTDNGMLQSELWKKLKLSTRDGSRLSLRLERRGMITREKILQSGRWTYKLIIEQMPISLESIQNSPCLTCPVEQKCDIDNVYPEPSPRHCELIKEWVVIESKKKK